MLGAVMAKVFVAPAAEQHAISSKKAGLVNLSRFCPARRSKGRDALGFPRPPDRHRNRDDDGGEPTRSRDIGALDKDIARVGVVGEPPPEESGWLIDRPAE